MYRFFLLSLCFLGVTLFAQEEAIQPIEGPIHEAYITQEYGKEILQAVPNIPPHPIYEEPPRKTDPESIWISGYWAWVREAGEYVWVSGIWRKLPPGQAWTPGKWHQYTEGWVWIPGYFSPEGSPAMSPVLSPPPTPLEEATPQAPNNSESYFWIAGQWGYDPTVRDYVWYKGRWEPLESDWVYTPASFQSTEKGTIYLPAFWDWPLELRGSVYDTIHIPKEHRNQAHYEPEKSLDPLYVVEKLYLHYPNYSTFFQQHYLTHEKEWMKWGAAPPWWQWSTYWGLSPRQSLGLFWWWSHPGYPQPFWVTKEIAEQIPPPPPFVVRMMRGVVPPPTVTSNGVIGTRELLKGMRIVSGKMEPILPTDPTQIVQMQQVANPKTQKAPYLRPTAKQASPTPPAKPYVDFPPPRKPVERVEVSPIPTRRLAQHTARPYEGPIPPGSYPPSIYETNPPEIEVNQNPAPEYFAPRYYDPHTPYYNEYYDTHRGVPIQGEPHRYEYPQTPLMLQHHDALMIHPQPQRNVPSPRVHQTPGDYSTLPGY
ncbi:MAG: hypothetical protein K940chlam9_00937 [Chlamydiae bacterium]|nr:hypothetical protein [Chlamydiota bacterium]